MRMNHFRIDAVHARISIVFVRIQGFSVKMTIDLSILNFVFTFNDDLFGVECMVKQERKVMNIFVLC